MALLIKRSPGGVSTQKAAGTSGAASRPAPIDILNPDSRKQAFAALFADESKPVQAKVTAMGNAPALKAIMDTVKDVMALRAMEQMATGSDEVSSKMLGQLSDRAAKLMGDAVKQMSVQVDKIKQQAEMIASTGNNSRSRGMYGGNAGGSTPEVVRKRGLTTTDKNELMNVIATCKDVSAASELMSKSASASAAGAADATGAGVAAGAGAGAATANP